MPSTTTKQTAAICLENDYTCMKPAIINSRAAEMLAFKPLDPKQTALFGGSSFPG